VELLKAFELRKAKYIKRWKGKDGKWRYLYPVSKEKPSRSQPIEKETPAYATPKGKEIIRSAVKRYGTTDDWEKAGYILASGQALDFSGGKMRQTIAHGDVAKLYWEEVDEEFEMKSIAGFMKDTGSIRVSTVGYDGPRESYDAISIQIVNRPTSQQYNALYDMLKEFPEAPFAVEISTSAGSTIDAKLFEMPTMRDIRSLVDSQSVMKSEVFNMELQKAFELRKAKYLKRTGYPGHYKYIYKEPKSGRVARMKPEAKVGVAHSENKGLTGHQKEVLSEYKNTSYLDTNGYLRGSISESEIRQSEYDVPDTIRTMDAAFSKAPKFSGRTEVYRGMDELYGLEVGSRIVDKGYLSVSTSQELAANFAQGSSTPVLIKIQAKGPYVDMETEGELILPREQRLRVTKISREMVKSSVGEHEMTVVYAALQTPRKK